MKLAMATTALAALLGLAPGSVAAIVGMPQCGKTRLAREADRAGAFPRRLVFDPYARRDRLEASRGRDVYPWPGRMVTPAQLCRNTGALDRNPLALVVAPERLDTERLGRQFSAIADLAWSTGDLTLIPEEAGLYSREARELVLRIASGGGHAGLRAVFIVQSLGRLHIDARRHVTTVIAFAQGEPGDLEDLRKRAGPDFSKQVQSLTPKSPPLVWTQGAAWSNSP